MTNALFEELYAIYGAFPKHGRRDARWVMPARTIDALIAQENQSRERSRTDQLDLAAKVSGYEPDLTWCQPIDHPGYDNPGTVFGLPCRVADVESPYLEAP
jgi:hypothetical protein